MRYRGMFIHGAHADTLACVVLVKLLELPEVAPHLSAVLQGLAQSHDPANRLAAEQVQSTLAEMRDARRLLARHRDELRGSGVGTSEPPIEADQSESAVSSLGLSVAEVAERWRISPSYITRRCRKGFLPATKVAGVWFIDQSSVEAVEAGRKPIDDQAS